MVLRIAYLLALRGRPLSYDASWFHTVGRNIASGQGYVIECPLITSCESQPTAYFPPLYPSLLAIPSFLGLESPTAHRLVSALLGGLTVVLIGLLARRLFGDRPGLIAAGLAALYPVFITTDGSLMSETLYLPLVVGTLLAGLWAADGHQIRRWLLVGAIIGLAALTRGEGVALLVFVVTPVALIAAPTRPRALLAIGASTLAALAVMAPWIAYNSGRFENPVVGSHNATTVIRGANCDDVYSGDQVGFWSYGCLDTLRPGADAMDESEFGRTIQDEGFRYAVENRGQLPRVMAIRVARTWGVYPQPAQLTWEAGEGRTRAGQALAWLVYGAVTGLAVAGWRATRPRGLHLMVIAGPVLMVTATSALTYGNQRFRIAAEVSLVLLAGAYIDRRIAAGRPHRPRSRREIDRRPSDTAFRPAHHQPKGPAQKDRHLREPHRHRLVAEVSLALLVVAAAVVPALVPSSSRDGGGVLAAGSTSTGGGTASVPSNDVTYAPGQPPTGTPTLPPELVPLEVSVEIGNPSANPYVVAYARLGEASLVVPLNGPFDLAEVYNATWRVVPTGTPAVGADELNTLVLADTGDVQVLTIGVAFNDGRSYALSDVWEYRVPVRLEVTPGRRTVVAAEGGDPTNVATPGPGGWHLVDFGDGPVWWATPVDGVLDIEIPSGR